jgi:Concanavalin A-like lectin/glucanases superfamily
MSEMLRRVMMLMNKSSASANDPYFNNVVLLMHFNTTTTDVKGHGMTISGAVGSDTTNKKFGSGSFSFPGAAYLYTPDSPDWTLGTGDWTAECWYRGTVNPAAYGTILMQCPADGSTGDRGGPWFAINSTGKVQGGFWVGGTQYYAAGTTTVTDGNWHHIAIVRSGGNIYAFTDGVLEGTNSTVTGIGTVDSTQSLVIGQFGAYPDYYLVGNLDDLRLTKGIARYTSGFTVPTTQFPDA